MTAPLRKKNHLSGLTPSAFKDLANYLYQESGIYLMNDLNNMSLFSHRLTNLLRDYDFSSYEELVQTLKSLNVNTELKKDFINCLTTNKTEFFREREHFDTLPKMVAEFSSKENIYIWCAACSTGQEVYSILISLHKSLPISMFNKIKILATDIDTDVLAFATEAQYSSDQVSNLTHQEKQTYFTIKNHNYCLKKEFTQKIHFSKLNLFNFPYSINKTFDIIFCRNVLIYFEQEDRMKICHQLLKYLNNNSYLFLGLSESASIKSSLMDYLGQAIYRKNV